MRISEHDPHHFTNRGFKSTHTEWASLLNKTLKTAKKMVKKGVKSSLILKIRQI